MEILIGCDPELFVTRNKVSCSAHGLIPGDKKNPFKVKKGAVQVDGMALEFNIEPAKTADEFYLNIDTVLKQLKKMVPDHEFSITPTMNFSDEVMRAQPKEALELGCDPDYNAYTGEENKKPDANRNMRTASGHVHIGWTSGVDINNPDHREDCFRVGRLLDTWLGAPSLLFDRDVKRRSMYGKAGCVRIKPYGVEYRTLSNAWLKHPDLIKWVFNNTRKAMELVMQGEDKVWESSDAYINYDRQLHEYQLDCVKGGLISVGVTLPPEV